MTVCASHKRGMHPNSIRNLKARGSGRNGLRTLNEKGYVRISHGPDRGKYEHRVIMAALCAEFCYYTHSPLWDYRAGLPLGFHVEHIDHVRTHNCPSNILLLQDVIHNAISRAHGAVMRKHAFSMADMSLGDIQEMCRREEARALTARLERADAAALSSSGDVPF